jgi:hypothetical protein
MVKIETKKEAYFRCRKCGDEIYWNTHKKLTHCKCGALGVDGCVDYVRLLGDEMNHEEIIK